MLDAVSKYKETNTNSQRNHKEIILLETVKSTQNLSITCPKAPKKITGFKKEPKLNNSVAILNVTEFSYSRPV